MIRKLKNVYNNAVRMLIHLKNIINNFKNIENPDDITKEELNC